MMLSTTFADIDFLSGQRFQIVLAYQVIIEYDISLLKRLDSFDGE